MSETPESNPGALVVSSPKALAVAHRQLRIAGQALARIERERYIEFFATHPQASRAFVEAVSRHYPCCEAMIDPYADLWQWESLSKSQVLPWSEALIERYADRWDWHSLSQNALLPWSEVLIERYVDSWDWSCVSRNMALRWNDLLIDTFFERWDWVGLSGNDALSWSDRLIASYSEMWDWEQLSENENLPWACDLVDQYSDLWTWGLLSKNGAIPWTEAFIERYAHRWDWNCLSENMALPWSEALIHRHEERWSWARLSCNEALPWTEAWLERYVDRWDWGLLSENRALPWSEALVRRYEERWVWWIRRDMFYLPLEGCDPFYMQRYHGRWYDSLSSNESLPWSEEFIECYAHNLDWTVLSKTRGLPWSDSLIARYAESWDWQWLSENSALPWSDSLLDLYADRWDWRSLSSNAALPWSEALLERYADRWYWDGITLNALPRILSRWPEPSIRAVMDRMLHGPRSGGDSIHAGCAADAVNQAEPHLDQENPGQPAGIDPEMLAIGTELAAFHIEAGARRFADFAQRITTDLDEPLAKLRPYLRTFYNGGRDMMEDAGHDVSEMDDPATVKREFERLFPEAMHGTGCARVPVPVQDKQCASDAIDHAKDEHHHENPAQPSGFDPELMEAGIYLAGFHVEAGARSFSAYSKAMIADLGAAVRPYLKSWYAAIKMDPRATEAMKADMDSMASVEDADVENMLPSASEMDDPTPELRESERLCCELTQGLATAPTSVPAQPKRITRRDVLRPFMDKLEDLLRQEDDPPATMRWLETCLNDEGLVGEMRTDNPMAFAIDLMENLLEKDPDSYIVPLQYPRAFENAEELVLAMLKGTWDY